MARFFPEKLLGEIFWDDDSLLATDQSDNNDPPPPPTASTQSAFVQYRDLPTINYLNGSNYSQSMSKRMLAFLRKSFPVETNKVQENERERGFRHMINERMRRQRQRHCCLALHSILPLGTKTDNNSVIQMAAKEILRLQGCKQELERKSFESNQGKGNSKVQYLRVPHPKSGIESMLETLKCLKHQGADTISIKSTFSPHQLFAALEIQTKVADVDGEKGSGRTFDELDWKLHFHAREGSNKKQKTIREALDQI